MKKEVSLIILIITPILIFLTMSFNFFLANKNLENKRNIYLEKMSKICGISMFNTTTTLIILPQDLSLRVKKICVETPFFWEFDWGKTPVIFSN